MSKIITTLHPEGHPEDDLYPNIEKENIPSFSIDQSKIDPDIYNMILSSKSGSPSYVGTTSQILALQRDVGLAVSTSNGKWYYWSVNSYVDSGLLYQNTILDNSVLKYDKNISNTAQLVSPYNDFNTMPSNTIVSFTIIIDDILNAPVTGKQGVVYTIGNTSGTILKQIFISSDDGLQYERFKWGASWRAWEITNDKISTSDVDNTILSYDKNIGSSTQIIAPYNNFNTMPVNRIVSFTIDVGSILNYPVNKQGVVYTIGNTQGTILKQFFTSINNEQYERFKWGASWTQWVQTNKAPTYIEYSSISLFKKIGVVGDSYASGEIYSGSTQLGDFYDISWLQIMARDQGFIGTNYSRGGLTTRSWLTNEKGLTLLNSSDPENLYILALGLNDRNVGLTYLGSPEDMETLSDTFYGNYAKIINAITQKAPNSKIIISTMAKNISETEIAFNNAIVNIGNHFNIPIIYQYNDDYFKSNYYLNRMIGNHPTAVNYSGMANAIKRLIEKCMIDNPNYFNDYTG